MTRETFIQEDDLADGILTDAKTKPGSNLQKLVDKIILDTKFVVAVPIGATDTTVRLDVELLDFAVSSGSGDVGVISDQNHKVFDTGTDNALNDGLDEEVIGDITEVAPVTFLASMTNSLTLAVTAGAPPPAGGDVVAGDTFRIQGQGLGADFVAGVVSSTFIGPEWDIVLDTPFPGISAVYTCERVRRWTLEFQDSTFTPFAMPASTVDLGIMHRAYLADVSETMGASAIINPGMVSEVAGGGMITGATFLTLTANATLTDERVFTPSTGISVVDGGANSTYTVTADLSTGLAGGQTVYGGTAASEDLMISSTTHATKGNLLFGSSAYNENTNRLGVGTATPNFRLDVVDTAQPTARFQNDNSGSPQNIIAMDNIDTAAIGTGAGIVYRVNDDDPVVVTIADLCSDIRVITAGSVDARFRVRLMATGSLRTPYEIDHDTTVDAHIWRNRADLEVMRLDDSVLELGAGFGFEMKEVGSVPGPAISAGEGRVWVRNNTPNVLIFTDDLGTDHVLNSGGTLGGSGTSGFISRFTAATTLADSSLRDNGTVVSLGTTATGSMLNIDGTTATTQPMTVQRDLTAATPDMIGFNNLGTGAIGTGMNLCFFARNGAAASVEMGNYQYDMRVITAGSEDARHVLALRGNGSIRNAYEIDFDTAVDQHTWRDRTGNIRARLTPARFEVINEMEIGGAFNHNGSTFGALGATPVVQTAAYTVSNVTTDRTYNANTTNINEIADVLGTLISDLQGFGFLG